MGFSTFNTFENAKKIDKTKQHIKATDLVLEELYDQVQNISTYSTDETVVGEWIDGRPIYRKIISIGYTTLPSNQWYDTNKIIDADLIINVIGLTAQGDHITFPLGGYYTNQLKVMNLRTAGLPVDTLIVKYVKTSENTTILSTTENEGSIYGVPPVISPVEE